MSRYSSAVTEDHRDDAASTHTIRVVLADDHALMRRSLRRLLDSEADVQVIAEAGDLVSAMRHVSRHLPHVLLLDLQMRDGSSIDLIRRLRVQVPETQIVVVTMEGSPGFARHVLDAGAVAFVLKEYADTELPAAVRAASRGERFVSAPVSAGLEGLKRAVTNDGLSERETEVLRLVALGLTNAEVSDQLHLSRRTVESHRRRIYHKLGLTRRSELVRYALTRHLVRT